MRQTHTQEKEQFKKLFKQEEIDKFEDRFKVLEAFLKTERHVTTGELVQILANDGHRYSHDFVRDTLRHMCRYGFAKRNRFNNGLVRYEHMHLGQHHDHMICTKCGKIMEFKEEPLEKLQEQIAASLGFHMLQHKMEIYGICSDCLKERVPHMPLSLAKQGERLLIKEFTRGANSRMRLMTMGFRVGDEIQVITNHNKGQMVVAVDFKRYVLGRGLSEKILVRPLTS
ncbi:transcriptional repressor [Thermodesulfobacteriota bacterium]